MLEAQAEVDTDMGTGGLDKIVERDDEGGGEQAEDDDNPSVNQRTIDEEVNRIYQLKQQL